MTVKELSGALAVGLMMWLLVYLGILQVFSLIDMLTGM